MGHQAPKMLQAHLVILCAHAHVSVPDKVHIHWWYSKDIGCRFPELQEHDVPVYHILHSMHSMNGMDDTFKSIYWGPHSPK